MIINELKNKNYFRYIQLLILDSKEIKNNTALIFLFEYEIIKIFFSTKEPLLRKIKYQWLIDELEKKESHFYLAQHLINLCENLSVKKEILKLLVCFQKIDDYMESPIKNVLFFKEINTIFNSIFKKIMQPNRDSFNISFFSQLIYFYYFDNNVKVHFYSEFNNILKTSKINELDCFEKTFVKICIKKSKNLEYMKISKLEFIYKLILCMVFR
ncbi:MAG: hypothetical protein CMP37_02100 [Rickettsiales bacterium]|nr:hypothetical protein [Rickettsiales bacterium]OUW72038.1 MAG: hypothetical protein CBD71_01990 [Rickettsiales bacterium TMED211]